MSRCQICRIGEVSGHSESGDRLSAECSNCGRYRIAKHHLQDLEVDAQRKEHLRELLAYLIRRRSRPDEWIPVTPELLERASSGGVTLPGAIEQLDNLILWLAQNTQPGQLLSIEYKTFQSVVGSATVDAFLWVLGASTHRGLMEGQITDDGLVGHLTLDAWTWYAGIGRHKRSRQAFMAMPFGLAKLNALVDGHFRPAVARAGFELHRLDDRPAAGSIDDRLRVEIRRSRLLICELTNDNSGAYFEAGFAEGLGIPVIYTCEKPVLDSGSVHFDTRNALIVPWTTDQPQLAGEMLTATIRNTLPEEAVLEDNPPTA